MTRDRARKKAIRARMAASGEAYSVAARKLAATGPAGDAADVHEIIACADRTLAQPSARIECECRTDIVLPERRPRPHPGPFGRLARLAAGAVWERVAPGVSAADLREAFTHSVGEGFVEAAARRYQVDYGAYAQMYIDGKLYGGRSGHPVQPRHRHRRPEQRDPLGLLMLLQGTTGARHVRDDTVRGTPCRMIAVQAGSIELTVWVDDQHVRRIRSEEHGSGRQASVSRIETLELWEFGVPVDSLDWSRLPSFRTPG